jgi:hypothetical protein
MTSRPQVGSNITVIVRTNAHKRVFVPQWNAFTPASPETMTYTGQVMKPDYWMKADEFNLTTGLPHFPVRTISMKNVISINGTDVNHIKADDVKVVNVNGSKGATYEVIVRNGVAETCTCPAFRFRGGRCKHLSMTS